MTNPPTFEESLNAYAGLRAEIPQIEARLLEDHVVADRHRAVENAKEILRAAIAGLEQAKAVHPDSALLAAKKRHLEITTTDLLATWNEATTGKTVTMPDGCKVQRKTHFEVQVTDGQAAAAFLLQANLWPAAVKTLELNDSFCRPLCEAGKLPGTKATVEHSLAFTAAKTAPTKAVLA